MRECALSLRYSAAADNMHCVITQWPLIDNARFLMLPFFLCACRRTRRHTEEDLHEVGEQAFEKGEAADARINGGGWGEGALSCRFFVDPWYSRHRLINLITAGHTLRGATRVDEKKKRTPGQIIIILGNPRTSVQIAKPSIACSGCVSRTRDSIKILPRAYAVLAYDALNLCFLSVFRAEGKHRSLRLLHNRQELELTSAQVIVFARSALTDLIVARLSFGLIIVTLFRYAGFPFTMNEKQSDLFIRRFARYGENGKLSAMKGHNFTAQTTPVESVWPEAAEDRRERERERERAARLCAIYFTSSGGKIYIRR